MTTRHVAVVGSGSLARSVCSSLAALAPSAAVPLRVTVLARDGAAADEMARTCRVRAAVGGRPVAFAAEPLGDEIEVVARLRPDVLVCCASAQSPYERNTAPSAWTRLVERTGFGVTLPLQATVVVPLARAVGRVSPETLLVNACFPDAVNPLLAALGLPVHCGIGNVATLAACLQAALDLPDQRELTVLGHHAHLAAPDDPADEVRVWSGGRQIDGVSALLAPYRAMARRELNAIAGHAAARLLVALATGTEFRTSLPGPLGLPGGYPVTATGRNLVLRLDAVTRAEAVAWNLRVGRRDGVEIADSRVSYPVQVSAVLAPHLPGMAAGWPVAALDEMTAQLTALRRRLRSAPADLVDAPRVPDIAAVALDGR